MDAARLGLPEERIAEKEIRPADGLLVGDDPAALARLFADPHFAVPGHLTG
ncbi:hypothetical protein ACH49O_13345 [Streptomyces coeruleorubidus]|uniref:hypothetical protein n=1 Tax=Streptomyces coeruleorubidus TaxID=116188 RepID=UPI0033D4AC0F